jgi:hypothetical protein
MGRRLNSAASSCQGPLDAGSLGLRSPAALLFLENERTLERDRLGAILPLSNCASENVDEVNASRTLLHPGRFDSPHDAVQENGAYGDEGKAVRRRGAPTALLSEISRIVGEGALSLLYVGARLPITMDCR